MSWLERIASRKYKLSVYRHEAAGWDSCAVGEAGDVVQHTEAGEPSDKLLLRLGNAFYDAVRDDDRKGALRLYLAIQRRVLRLAGLSR